jgi:hypothetical protein
LHGAIHLVGREFMRSSLLAVLAAAAVSPLLALSFANFGSADGRGETRVTGPVVRDNLAVYFVHGKSTPGEVPLTLEEALLNGVVKVHETGSVNELEMENLGAQEVFVQSGDIVKGGQQDRTIARDMLLRPKSGRVPVGAFCVEQGRWSRRPGESVNQFDSSKHYLATNALRLACRKAGSQGEVWKKWPVRRRAWGRTSRPTSWTGSRAPACS